VKNRFQILPFKFNLHCYNVVKVGVVLAAAHAREGDAAAAAQLLTGRVGGTFHVLFCSQNTVQLITASLPVCSM
jgi:hypothetical protein